MNRKIVASALAMMALAAGCNLSKSALREKADGVTATVFNANEGTKRPGRVLQPKFCQVDSAILLRPIGDKAVDESLWNVADEQGVAPEARKALEANGLRVGVITGALPADVVEAFKPSPPKKDTQWVHVAIPEGDHTPIVLGTPVDSVTLLLNHGGKVEGRDYHDAGGRLDVTASHRGPHDVSVRLVPGINHGDRRRTIAPIEGAGPFTPREFGIKDGQQEDLLRDLAASIDLQPGQTAVVGCRSTPARSLGTFLFLQHEPSSDQTYQAVLLLQASRTHDGAPPTLKPDDPDAPADLAVRPFAVAPKEPGPSKD